MSIASRTCKGIGTNAAMPPELRRQHLLYY
jgi:hypothetical protein